MDTKEPHVCSHCGAHCGYPLAAMWNVIYICNVCARKLDALVETIRSHVREERERKE